MTVRETLDRRCRNLGWMFKDAATFMGMSEATLRKKCNAPESFTICEMKRLCSMLTVSQSDDVLREVGL